VLPLYDGGHFHSLASLSLPLFSLHDQGALHRCSPDVFFSVSLGRFGVHPSDAQVCRRLCPPSNRTSPPFPRSLDSQQFLPPSFIGPSFPPPHSLFFRFLNFPPRRLKTFTPLPDDKCLESEARPVLLWDDLLQIKLYIGSIGIRLRTSPDTHPHLDLSHSLNAS